MSRYSNMLAGLALVTLACGTRASTPDPTVSGGQRGSRDFVGAEEIERAGGGNALDFIRKARPMWLIKRGPQSIQNEGDVIVYMGTARMGGLQALKEIPLSSLMSLRYLDIAAANYRFGAGHPYGAIIVSMAQ